MNYSVKIILSVLIIIMHYFILVINSYEIFAIDKCHSPDFFINSKQPLGVHGTIQSSNSPLDSFPAFTSCNL